MCEECESPNALHLTYAEKRKRISAVWKPARKAGRPMIASETSAPAASAAGKGGSMESRDD
jgi:hypothetical protein